jgi:hypothetical protein
MYQNAIMLSTFFCEEGLLYKYFYAQFGQPWRVYYNTLFSIFFSLLLYSFFGNVQKMNILIFKTQQENSLNDKLISFFCF